MLGEHYLAYIGKESSTRLDEKGMLGECAQVPSGSYPLSSLLASPSTPTKYQDFLIVAGSLGAALAERCNSRDGREHE